MQDLRTLTLEAWHSDSHVKNCIGIWLKNCYYNASSMPRTAKNDYSQISLFLCLIMPSDCGQKKIEHHMNARLIFDVKMAKYVWFCFV